MKSGQLQQIREQLKELEQLADTMSASSFTTVDKDLLRRKCVALYENILQLQSETLPAEEPAETHMAQPVVKETPAPVLPLFTQPEKTPEPIIEPEEEPVIPVVQTPPPAVVVIEEEEIKTPTEIQNELITKIVEERRTEDEVTTPPTPIEEASLNELSLHEKLSKTVEAPPAVYDKIISKPGNLKQSISLNQKIAFVNDLFGENVVEYAKAIEKLNSAASGDEALRFFTELKHQRGWNNESGLVRELEQLVQKRFA